ncbi:MAG: hypothetical protein ACI35W_06320 [Anaeroplasmataceae bacterium]
MTFKNRSKNSLNKYFSRVANLSLLNTKELKKLHKLKYLIYKYNTNTKEYSIDTIYKNITKNDKKIIFFDCVISYEKNDNEDIIKPYFNIYIPTLFLDYIKFAYKNSILSDPSNINLSNLESLEREIYLIFLTQNKDYTVDDYDKIKQDYNLDSKSNYKTKIKALHDYTMKNNSIPGFYFFLMVMYDIYPIKYMGKCSMKTNTITEYENIFFVEPEKNK